jgi:hypothetical protein
MMIVSEQRGRGIPNNRSGSLREAAAAIARAAVLGGSSVLQNADREGLRYELSRYLPPDDYVNQDKVPKEAGTSDSYPKCLHCWQWKDKCDAQDYSLCTAECAACSSKEHNGSLCPRIWASRAWYKKRLARALREEVERPSIRPSPDEVVLMGKDPEKWRPVLILWSPITEDESVPKKRAADEELEEVRAAKVGRKLALDRQKQLEDREKQLEARLAAYEAGSSSGMGSAQAGTVSAEAGPSRAAGDSTLSATASVFVPQAQHAGLAEDSLAAVPERSEEEEAWAALRALVDALRNRGVKMQDVPAEEEESTFDAVHIKQEEQ